ncbi:MAG TPA: CocE/NonD family hydrolase, partial [Cytophagales bacterium]
MKQLARAVFLLLSAFLPSLTLAGKVPFRPADRREDSLYLVQHYQVRKEMIPLRDGVKLYTEIFVPRDAAKAKPYPFLMTRTPYNAARSGSRLHTFPSFARLVREGFIIVNQDVR